MKKKDIEKPISEFKGYEEARKGKKDETPIAASTKEVKAALNRINPDEHSMDRG